MLFTNHCRYATYFSFKIQTSLIGVGTKNHNSHVKQSPQNMLFVRNVSMFNLCCILIKFPHDQNAKPPQFNIHINKVGEGFNCPLSFPLPFIHYPGKQNFPQPSLSRDFTNYVRKLSNRSNHKYPPDLPPLPHSDAGRLADNVRWKTIKALVPTWDRFIEIK